MLLTVSNAAIFSTRWLKKVIVVSLPLATVLLTMTSSLAQPRTNAKTIGKKAFRQEIARLEIIVEREGYEPLPISQVPRVQKGDLLRIRMPDEPVNGIRPNESFWDWTLLVAFVNPSRNEVEEESVSKEISF